MNCKGCNKKEAIICVACDEIGKGEAIALRLKKEQVILLLPCL